jgi:hypothetical protein
VTPASGHATTCAASAAQNVLSGTAKVESDFTFSVPSAGTYRIMISYADADADGESSGNYNTKEYEVGWRDPTADTARQHAPGASPR